MRARNPTRMTIIRLCQRLIKRAKAAKSASPGKGLHRHHRRVGAVGLCWHREPDDLKQGLDEGDEYILNTAMGKTKGIGG